MNDSKQPQGTGALAGLLVLALLGAISLTGLILGPGTIGWLSDNVFGNEHLDYATLLPAGIRPGKAEIAHQLVELFLLGGGSGKSNRKFVHAVHYPAKAGDNRISGVLLRRSAMLSCAW